MKPRTHKFTPSPNEAPQRHNRKPDLRMKEEPGLATPIKGAPMSAATPTTLVLSIHLSGTELSIDARNQPKNHTRNSTPEPCTVQNSTVRPIFRLCRATRLLSPLAVPCCGRVSRRSNETFRKPEENAHERTESCAQETKRSHNRATDNAEPQITERDDSVAW